ncbi:DUF4349 domain-containing protein [Kutzneria viridogrisea]|uniref:DUF4349 domain-containing protein n=1 Tax=Kutzneria viridogrisea TaxID=47990 RepID=A0ABR6BYL7_9PSEU|nr:hypothetical protein [Kutzneria viridogrisea]
MKLPRTLVLAVAATALLAGCTAGGRSESSVAVAPGVGKADASGGSPQQKQPVASTFAPAGTGRQIVRTANLAVKVPDVPSAVNSARKIGTDAGGYSSDENSGGGHATLTLKVPVDKTGAVLDRLAALGDTTSRTEHAEDVTEQVVDVDSRLAAQRTSVDRVRALLEKANSIADITAVESELTKREADLASLQQRHDALAGQVGMSTIAVDLSRSEGAAPPAEQPGFLNGLGAGWTALLGTLQGIGLALGAVLPFAVVIGIPGAAVWWLLRRRRVVAPEVAEQD